MIFYSVNLPTWFLSLDSEQDGGNPLVYVCWMSYQEGPNQSYGKWYTEMKLKDQRKTITLISNNTDPS